MSPILHSKIAAVRSKQGVVAASRGVAAMAGAIVLLFMIGMLLDWYAELPRIFRAALLAVDLTVLTYLVLTFVVAPILWGPDEDDIALMVEREKPEFRTRLIASVQLGRQGAIPAGASSQIVQAMIRQTEELAEPMDFAAVVKTDALLKMAIVAGLIVLFGAAMFVYGHDVSSDLLARAFLSDRPVPRKTRINVLSKDLTIAIGDNAVLAASVRGVVPGFGTVSIEYPSGRSQNFTINPSNDNSTVFKRTIENVQESFSYRVYLNDGRSEWFKVRALPRPGVVAADFVQTYPAYTHRSPEKRPPGDLSLLAGSQLAVKVKASKGIKEGAVRMVGLEKDVRMAVMSADGTELTGIVEIPPKGLSGLSIRLTDSDGIQSKGETVYPVDVVLDKEPVVRVVYPDRKEELATQQAKVLFSFEATDDYGIDKVFIRYHVDSQAEKPGDEKYFELDMGPEKAKAGGRELRDIRLRHEFDLVSLEPKPLETQTVEYWVEVRDGNDVTGPGKGLSDHYRVRIVSEIEKRADLMNRLNDQLTTIDVVTGDQEKLNQRLGALILKK